MTLSATTVVVLLVGGRRPMRIMAGQAIEPSRGAVLTLPSVLRQKALTERQPHRGKARDPVVFRTEFLRPQRDRRTMAFATSFDRLQR